MTATLTAPPLPEVDSQYIVHRIPIFNIFNDTEFNCRGVINPFEVQDLAESIREGGLQIPIVIQPRCDVARTIPDTFAFRIIAGHRRFISYRVLNKSEPTDPRWQCIPAMIKTGLNEIQARVFNLEENLKRKELNILQEANAIRGLQEAGVPRDRVSAMIKKSSGWVQTRYNLLALPPEVQEAAAAGKVSQLQIKQLFSLPSPEEQLQGLRKIKEALERGEKVTEHVGKKQTQKASVKKNRGPEDIFRMSELIAKNVGYGLTTRFAAWATGAISSEDLFVDIGKAAEEAGKPKFYPPTVF